MREVKLYANAQHQQLDFKTHDRASRIEVFLN